MTATEVLEKLEDRIHNAYFNGEFPPYALASWDDRNRYIKWLLGVIAELKEKEATPAAEPMYSVGPDFGPNPVLGEG